MTDSAVRAVFEASYRRLVGQLYGVCGDLTEAEEVVAEAFSRAVRHQRTFAHLGNPEAWLRAVAVDEIRTRRRRRRMATTRGRAEVRHPLLDDERLSLVAALQQLPTPQREAMALHYLAGLSVTQIAEATGAAGGTVVARLSRGRARLVALLAEVPDELRRRTMDDLDLLLSPDISRAAEASANPPDFATLAPRGVRRTRRRTVATVLAAAAAAAALVGSPQLGVKPRAVPAVPPSTTVTASTPNPLATGQAPDNSQITSAEKYLAAADAGGYMWRSFDVASGKGLFVSPPEERSVESITVVGTHGRLATLTCGGGLHCSPDPWLAFAAALGPGADEVTIESGDRTVQVVAYDGSVRRTLDVGVSLPRGDTIDRLSWSPDGRRLAVLTSRASSLQREIWLVDADGAGRRAYSAKIWTLGPWSADSQSLLVDEYVGPREADVVRLRLRPDGSPFPVTATTLARSDRHFDWAGNIAWSPDGTRVAVRTATSIDEISAEDGTVLDRHPHIEGWLIWPTGGR